MTVKDCHVIGISMTENDQKVALYFFLPKKMETEKFVFYVVAFDPIKI